jgi:hypothetical protein
LKKYTDCLHNLVADGTYGFAFKNIKGIYPKLTGAMAEGIE